MTEIDRINDKFFKKTFSDLDNTRAFLKIVLPEPLRKATDFSKIEIDTTNYVSKLRLIIPVVFYHGKEKWNIPRSFIEQFDVSDEIKKFLLNYRYILFDTRDWDFRDKRNEELKDNVFLLTALALMKSAGNILGARQKKGANMAKKFLILLVVLVFIYGYSQERRIKLSIDEKSEKIIKKRVALVIGNSSYKISPLKNPVNDAVDMAEVFKKCTFDVIIKTNAAQKDMEDVVRDFGRKLKNNEVGLFYYAGHGIQINGRNYLIPIGVNIKQETDVKYKAVNMGRIIDEMKNAKSRVNIIIIDACRNNPFARSFSASATGLASVDAPAGTLIAYATAPNSIALDGTGRNGIYTQSLLKYIMFPNLTIEQMLKKVRVSVMQETEDKQVPWESTSLRGDFFFVGQPAQVVKGVNHNKSDILSNTSEAGYSLNIDVEPKDAKIRFLGYDTEFSQGIFLEPGRYNIEVSRCGYKPRKELVSSRA